MKRDEIPPNILRCMNPEDRARYGGPGIPPPAMEPQPAKATTVPNKTETEALDVLRLHLMDFEGRTFDVVGHKYTPDWYGNGFAVEAKGEHIHSRDSRILFDAARLAHPELTWIWARKRTTGRAGKRWEIQIFPAKGTPCTRPSK